MKRFSARVASGFRRSVKSEDGAVSIEFVFWLPVLVFLLSVTADASLIFGTKAQILRVVQDANRATSVGRLRTTDETVAYIRTNIGRYATTATITSQFTSGVVSSTVVIPASSLTATGLLSGMSNISVTINAQHLLES